MTPGTVVTIVGDKGWDGSVFRGHRGRIVPAPPGKPACRDWVWVDLHPNYPPNTPHRPLQFRLSTLKVEK